MGRVTIFLEKLTSLKDTDGIGGGKSDPFVKLHLEQDNVLLDKNYGKKVSTKKKNTVNPVFEETFEFPDVPTLNNLTLHVDVMDDDIGMDDVLGECSINLEKLKPGEPMEIKKIINHKKSGWFSKKATIYLKVTYTEE